MPSPEDGAILVDLGSGPGNLAIEVHRLLPLAAIIGIDPSGEMLEIARANALRSGMSKFEARVGRAEDIPVETDAVDLVYSQFSLHEWKDPARGLCEVFRILKRGGIVILRDFNRAWFSGWKRGTLRLLCASVGESYEDHLEMFRYTFQEISGYLKAAGFDEVQGGERGLVLSLRGTKE